MPGQQVLADFKGLVTAPGSLLRTAASCTRAENVVFDAPGVLRKRRGFSRQPGGSGGPIWKLLTSRVLAGSALVHTGTGSTANVLRKGDGSVALTTLTTIDSSAVTRPPSKRMLGAVCGLNHYVTSDEGVRRVESDFGAIRYAGMPRGSVFPHSVVAGSAIADGYARAYRVTWHRKDASGAVLGGAPTHRAVVRNQTGTTGYAAATARAARVRIPLPKEFGTTSTALTTAYFYRLWATRTQQLSLAEPDDECYLVAEAYLVAGDIAAGYVQVDDNTPDSFLTGSGSQTPALHTNTLAVPYLEDNARQGVVNEDAPPPSADDVAYWAERMWYGNTTQRPYGSLSLLTALADGDTITVEGTVYTARAAPAAATDFQLVTGYASTASNLEATLQALTYAINTGTAAEAYAYCVGGTYPTIAFESRNFTGIGIDVSANKWRGATTTTSLQIDATAQANGLAFSKSQRADAVAPINTFSVGPVDSRVLRMVPFRDRLLVFTDYGIWQVTGRSWQDFAAAPFDLTYRLRARECVAVCDDRVYAWCYEGIIEIDSAGVRAISAPIENYLENVVKTATDTGIAASAWAVAYGRRHRVMFWWPLDYVSGELGCSQWLTYDTRTGAWSTGAITGTSYSPSTKEQRTTGVVDLTSDLLLVGNWHNTASDAYLFRERQTYGAADYQDTTAGNVTTPVAATVRWQWVQPDELKGSHWQQLVLNFDQTDAGVAPWETPPTGITVGWQTDGALTASESVVVATSFIARVETPTAVRRAQSLQVTLTHSTAEYMGVAGMALGIGAQGTFARRA